MATFGCETFLGCPVEVAFDLSRDIDFHLKSMAESGERAVAGRTSGLIELGESVTWRATHFKIPFRMTSKIMEIDRPNMFVDEQTSGPFKRFRHVHTFTAVNGGTEMVDEIDFTAPAGPLGKLVDRLFLDGYMQKLITERNQQLKVEAERSV